MEIKLNTTAKTVKIDGVNRSLVGITARTYTDFGSRINAVF